MGNALCSYIANPGPEIIFLIESLSCRQGLHHHFSYHSQLFCTLSAEPKCGVKTSSHQKTAPKSISSFFAAKYQRRSRKTQQNPRPELRKSSSSCVNSSRLVSMSFNPSKCMKSINAVQSHIRSRTLSILGQLHFHPPPSWSSSHTVPALGLIRQSH